MLEGCQDRKTRSTSLVKASRQIGSASRQDGSLTPYRRASLLQSNRGLAGRRAADGYSAEGTGMRTGVCNPFSAKIARMVAAKSAQVVSAVPVRVKMTRTRGSSGFFNT